MTCVVSIRFKSRGKVYFFDPGGLELTDGSSVVVETSKGLELGECARGNHEVDDDNIVKPLRPVIRLATADDMRVAEINKSREKEAFEICQRKIIEHKLDMKLVDVECNFEGNKIMFFFTSDGRVDFRELVKDLASVFRTRIELRQIGVRDEAKMLGGLGICGRPFCCSQFLNDFQPVSTKMAKTQSMSLNPTKISGSCGRLMCCLRYEQEAYEDLVKSVPKNGTFVQTEAGYGSVSQVNLLRKKIKVRLDGEGEQVVKSYDADDVAVIPGGRPKPGEPLPNLLAEKIREKQNSTAEKDVEAAAAMNWPREPESRAQAGERASAFAENDQRRKQQHRRPRGTRPQRENAGNEKKAAPGDQSADGAENAGAKASAGKPVHADKQGETASVKPHGGKRGPKQNFKIHHAPHPAEGKKPGSPEQETQEKRRQPRRRYNRPKPRPGQGDKNNENKQP